MKRLGKLLVSSREGSSASIQILDLLSHIDLVLPPSMEALLEVLRLLSLEGRDELSRTVRLLHLQVSNVHLRN